MAETKMNRIKCSFSSTKINYSKCVPDIRMRVIMKYLNKSNTDTLINVVRTLITHDRSKVEKNIMDVNVDTLPRFLNRFKINNGHIVPLKGENSLEYKDGKYCLTHVLAGNKNTTLQNDIIANIIREYRTKGYISTPPPFLY